jgi:hypothetical protein
MTGVQRNGLLVVRSGLAGTGFRLRAEALLDFMENMEMPKEGKTEEATIPRACELVRGELS